MRPTSWKVFRDKQGWYLATVKGKPSKHMQSKADADTEAARRNARWANYQKAVLEGHAGRLPFPAT